MPAWPVEIAPMVVEFIRQDPISPTDCLAVKAYSKTDHKTDRPTLIVKELEKWDKKWEASKK